MGAASTKSGPGRFHWRQKRRLDHRRGKTVEARPVPGIRPVRAEPAGVRDQGGVRVALCRGTGGGDQAEFPQGHLEHAPSFDRPPTHGDRSPDGLFCFLDLEQTRVTHPVAAKVQSVGPEAFEDIYPLLTRLPTRTMSKQDWR